MTTVAPVPPERRPGAARASTAMPPEEMETYLRDRIEDGVVDSKIAYGQLTMTISPDRWVSAVKLAKTDPRLDMAFFDWLTCVDRAEPGFEIVVHLYSVRHHHHLTLRSIASGGRDNPTFPTITDVYRGANWYEREVYDMFGVEFEGHPDLRPRILTVENFEGFPLRKDFLLSSREAKPWPGAKEPEERHEPGESATAGPARRTAGAGSATAADAPVSAEDKAAAAKSKAERAKAKAAEMRAKKARERGDAPAPAAGEATTDAEVAPTSEQVAASEAQMTRESEAQAAAQAEPGDDTSSDLIAESAEQLGGGDTEGEAAAAAATAAGDQTASTPEGAAEVAESAIAKDAAAGSAAGDMAARATQDAPGADEPVIDPEAEAKAAQGAPPAPAGTPGVEAEGRHGGAEQQSGARPAAETPGMTSPDGDAQHPSPTQAGGDRTADDMGATPDDTRETPATQQAAEDRDDASGPTGTGTDAADRGGPHEGPEPDGDGNTGERRE